MAVAMTQMSDGGGSKAKAAQAAAAAAKAKAAKEKAAAQAAAAKAAAAKAQATKATASAKAQADANKKYVPVTTLAGNLAQQRAETNAKAEAAAKAAKKKQTATTKKKQTATTSKTTKTTTPATSGLKQLTTVDQARELIKGLPLSPGAGAAIGASVGMGQGDYDYSNYDFGDYGSGGGGWSGLENPYVRPDYVDVITPELRTASALAELYGLDYNQDSIYNMFNGAVDKQYATRYAQQDISDNKYYDNVAALNDTAQDVVRSQNAAAIATGASKGTQAANQLAAILGISQQTADGATEQALARSLLASEKGAAQAQSQIDSRKYYDTLGTTLGSMSRQLYSDDIQQMTSQLGYNQGINTDYAGVSSQEMAANAAIRQAELQAQASALVAEQNRLASEYTADRGVESSATYGSQAALTNSASSKYTTDANSAANKYATDANAAANRYAADTSAAAMLKSGYGAGASVAAANTANSVNSATDYTNKIMAAANNGASHDMIQQMIKSGMTSGALSAGALKMTGAATWNDALYNAATGKTKATSTLPKIGGIATPKSTTKTPTNKALGNPLAGLLGKVTLPVVAQLKK